MRRSFSSSRSSLFPLSHGSLAVWDGVTTIGNRISVAHGERNDLPTTPRSTSNEHRLAVTQAYPSIHIQVALPTEWRDTLPAFTIAQCAFANSVEPGEGHHDADTADISTASTTAPS